MKYLVVSDSHGNFNKLLNIIESNSEISKIIFLGDGIRDIDDLSALYPDKTFYTVSGNCDLMSLRPSWDIIETSKGKILYAHGDAFSVKASLGRLALETAKNGCSIALFGHTHIPITEFREGIEMFNPGSAADGRYGVLSLTDKGLYTEHKTL